jgi:hypothetical protein
LRNGGLRLGQVLLDRRRLDGVEVHGAELSDFQSLLRVVVGEVDRITGAVGFRKQRGVLLRHLEEGRLHLIEVRVLEAHDRPLQFQRIVPRHLLDLRGQGLLDVLHRHLEDRLCVLVIEDDRHARTLRLRLRLGGRRGGLLLAIGGQFAFQLLALAALLLQSLRRNVVLSLDRRRRGLHGGRGVLFALRSKAAELIARRTGVSLDNRLRGFRLGFDHRGFHGR